MKRGDVRAGPELGHFLQDLISEIRNACGVGNDLRSWCSWSGWAVRNVLQEREAADAQRISTEQMIQRIRLEKREARGGLEEFVAQSGFTSLRECIQETVRVDGEV